MKSNKILYIILLVILFFSPTASAAQSTKKASQEPLESLKKAFEQGIEIIILSDDSNLSLSDNNASIRERLRDIINELFDFNRISMLTVSRWKSFTENEKKDFVEVFTEFLGNTYVDKIHEAYDNDKIQYLKQNIINENKAVVSTLVLRKNSTIPVNYSMINIKGEWKVYDVKIEGVSLVQNYRNQFTAILLNDTPEQLIRRIKDKNIK